MVFIESKGLLFVADFPSVQIDKDFSQTLVQIAPSPHCRDRPPQQKERNYFQFMPKSPWRLLYIG
ncbi:MAG: hypothetical protein ACYT04_43460 [Nostoc sp.]